MTSGGGHAHFPTSIIPKLFGKESSLALRTSYQPISKTSGPRKYGYQAGILAGILRSETSGDEDSGDERQDIGSTYISNVSQLRTLSDATLNGSVENSIGRKMNDGGATMSSEETHDDGSRFLGSEAEWRQNFADDGIEKGVPTWIVPASVALARLALKHRQQCSGNRETKWYKRRNRDQIQDPTDDLKVQHAEFCGCIREHLGTLVYGLYHIQYSDAWSENVLKLEKKVKGSAQQIIDSLESYHTEKDLKEPLRRLETFLNDIEEMAKYEIVESRCRSSTFHHSASKISGEPRSSRDSRHELEHEHCVEEEISTDQATVVNGSTQSYIEELITKELDDPVDEHEGTNEPSRCTTTPDSATTPSASDTHQSLKADERASPITESHSWIPRTSIGFARELVRITRREAKLHHESVPLGTAFHQEMTGYLRELASLLTSDKAIPSSIPTLSIESILAGIPLVGACLEKEDLKGVMKHVKAILRLFELHELEMSGTRKARVKREWKLRKAAVVASVSS